MTVYNDKKIVSVMDLKAGDKVIVAGKTWNVMGYVKIDEGKIILRLKDGAKGWDRITPESATIYKRIFKQRKRVH
tara:strand:- start:40 stop:264 length:225 start_codon:yes stop_codon:yes gene_type:complete